MRFGFVLAPAALIGMAGLAACSDSRASSQAASNTSAAPAPPAKAGGNANPAQARAGEPVRTGHCNVGNCSWFESRAQQIVRASGEERLVRVTLATGTSTHAEYDFPSDPDTIPIAWSGSEEAYVFCSKQRPSVIRRLRDGGWEAARIDLLEGQVAVGDSRVIYGLICHLNENWSEEGFFARQGYRPAPGEALSRLERPDAIPFSGDPRQPAQSGMMITSSSPPPAQALNIPMPPPPPLEARIPPPRPAPPPQFELVVVNADGVVTDHRPFGSMAACQRAQAAAQSGANDAICVRH